MINFYRKRAIKRFAKGLVPQALWQFIRRQFPNQRGDSAAENILLKDWYEARQLAEREGNDPDFLPGINLVGYLKASTGLGEAARSSIKGLDQAKIPFQLIDFEFNIPENQQVDLSYSEHSESNFKYKVNLLHVNPLEMPFLWETFGKKYLTRHYTIGFWYWELLELPESWLSRFNVVDEVWTATDFVKQSVEKKSPVPVIKIPPCVQPVYDDGLTRGDFGLPENKFLFMCAYDVLSSHQRKNPLAAIEAFKRAFGKGDQAVGMVIKVNNALENRQAIAQLKRELSGYSNFYFLEEIFSRTKFNTLIHLIDVYISLHRSEGFGLIPAEAMYLGKPVVMTRWSGNTDLMTEDNSCGVDFRLIPVGQDVWPYQPDQVWADADIDHAAFYLKQLFSDSDYYSTISNNAASFMRTHFSPQVVGHLMRSRLDQLGLL